ncbi:hypothetical protein KY290_036188 [Solanum tuberosum]|uniref:MULE transposase domain-containing protein n=1 Tax=Solanum tuberosum TaxID=4113 RepID=A0ABQ7TTH0_SOLTU|nr:hypothetical protein KY290_036188 [Solanum tuberosum]
MVVPEFVVAGGDYMGVWEETPKSWNWKSFSKTTVPIALRRNGSYDDMIASVIEAGELTCEPNDLSKLLEMLEGWCGCHGNGPRNSGGWIFMLTGFSYMFETLNIGSRYCIMVNEDSHKFMYYFLAFGACIKGFVHLRKIIAVDDTHLHGKYVGVLLSAVVQDTENHAYPIAFCVVDKENDASWTFFFEKLKEIVVDEPDLCFISDRHKSIANSIVNIYNHAHHKYCMRHLGENLRENHHCGDYLYLYYNVTKAYSLEEFDNHFVEFKNKCSTATAVLEHDIGFEKRSKEHFPGNRYDVMTTNIAESLNAMLIDEREYPMASIFNLIAKREYDLIKIPCAHAIVALRSKHGNEYGMSIYDYSSPLYKVKAYLLAYMYSINIVPLESE